ncbi:MAG: hypothetical protein HYX48_05180 [Chlamydiales bacterium]|nr:hypothetical protein [Chlamydiales bacterium]
MAFLSCVLPTYDYSYFNDANQLQTMQLNILQCIFRRLFGWYEETHIKNVVNEAYMRTFEGRSIGDAAEDQQFLRLLQKADHAYGEYYAPLSRVSTPQTPFFARYNLAYRNPEGGGDLKIVHLIFYIGNRAVASANHNGSKFAPNNAYDERERLVEEKRTEATFGGYITEYMQNRDVSDVSGEVSRLRTEGKHLNARFADFIKSGEPEDIVNIFKNRLSFKFAVSQF